MMKRFKPLTFIATGNYEQNSFNIIYKKMNVVHVLYCIARKEALSTSTYCYASRQKFEKN